MLLAGFGANAYVENPTSVECRVSVTDTVRATMNLPKEQVTQMLQGLQLPQELLDAVTAPGVEHVGMSINVDDMRYLLGALGLDQNMVQVDELTGTAKVGMTQAAMPQLLGLLQSFPGVMTMQMDPTTKKLQMKINSEAIQNILKDIPLNADSFDLVSDAEGKNLTVIMESENVRALADGLKAVIEKNKAANGGAGGSFDLASLLGAGGAKVNLTQNIKDPIMVSSTTDKLKVYGFTLNNDYCIVILDASACKGKLKGIDKTAYFEVDGVKYPLKGVKEATVPDNADTAMEWDAEQPYLKLEFPGIKMKPDSKMKLVLSTAKNGIQIETKFRTNG